MVVVAIAAFLPWVSIFGISVTGIEGDGQITFVCAVAGLAAYLFLARNQTIPRRRALLAIWAIGSGLTVLVGFYDMNGAAAIGLYLTAAGGVGWAAATVMEYRVAPAENTETSLPDDQRVKCPDCAESVPAMARICHYCGHVLRPDPPRADDEIPA
jgi:hypothetical protein